MRIVTGLGGSGFLIPLVVVLGLWYRRRAGSWRPLALLGSAYVGAFLQSNGLKELVDRGRPPAALAIGQYDSPAFPSGHVTHAAAVWTWSASSWPQRRPDGGTKPPPGSPSGRSSCWSGSPASIWVPTG
jgi:membrane-associated phospholipid phosphatase